MHMNFIRILAMPALTAAVIGLSLPSAVAQQYPDRTVTVIVGYNAGGGTDTIARLAADSLSKKWRQQVIVSNRPGAAGAIGVRALKAAVPDGYTLGMWSTSDVGNAAVHSGLNYDLLTDFVPISQVASGATVLVVNKNLPIRTFADYIKYGKEHPGKLNVSVVTGGDLHLDTIRINVAAGIKTALIDYPGTAPGLTDVVAGHTDAILLPIGPAKPHIESGALIPIAVGSKERSELLPNVPSMSEVIPGLTSTFFYGLAAPKGTPPDVIAKINAAVNGGLDEPALKKKLASLGFKPEGSTPDEFREMIAQKLKFSRDAAALAGMTKSK
jgi:tripartite-type tricarboxylate transporter receptor subunit TctC